MRSDHSNALVYETTMPAGSALTVEGQVHRQAFILVAGEATVSVAGARLRASAAATSSATCRC